MESPAGFDKREDATSQRRSNIHLACAPCLSLQHACSTCSSCGFETSLGDTVTWLFNKLDPPGALLPRRRSLNWHLIQHVPGNELASPEHEHVKSTIECYSLCA